jgi:cobalt-zinc-cadmium resistance protein CzcA
LYGWQIGAAFPLWVPKQQAEVKQAKIESEIAFNEFGYKKITIAVEIENLLFELNKYFRQIRYFRENALPEAEVLLNTALSQLNTEEIDYTEYLQSISLVIQIRQDFYLAINNYNQTAIQLEIYGD